MRPQLSFALFHYSRLLFFFSCCAVEDVEEGEEGEEKLGKE